jgi:hypothetical protein
MSELNFDKKLAEEAINETIMDKKEKKFKHRKDKELKTQLALDFEGVVDVLDDGEKLVYLMESGETKETIVTEDGIFTPPNKNTLPYLLANKKSVLGLISDTSDSSDGSLYTHLLSYHKGLSDLPNELFYDLLVLWDFHTYFLDKLHFSPILYLLRLKWGKSRQVGLYLCFKRVCYRNS